MGKKKQLKFTMSDGTTVISKPFELGDSSSSGVVACDVIDYEEVIDKNTAGLYYNNIFVPWDDLVEQGHWIVDECGRLCKGNSHTAENLFGRIVLPDSITSISNYAFQDCKGLTGVTISNSVATIESYAFGDCYNLESVLFKDDPQLRSIDYSTFYNCTSLTSIQLPLSVSYVGGQAFYNCSSLTSIEILGNVSYIGSYAFQNCDQLVIYCEAPSRPSGWTSNWNYSNCSVFWGCNNITTNEDFDYVLHNDRAYLVKSKRNEAHMYVPPLIDNKIVASIGGIFANNTTIQDISIPSGVTSIGAYAFYGCSNLTSISIPDSVISIDESAFYNSGLTSVSFGATSQLTSIGRNAFAYCRRLPHIEIPSSVTNIGNSAFSNCDSLTGIYITDIVSWCNIDFTTYSANPLYYAKNLYLNNELVTDLAIPKAVTDIGCVFRNCTSLTSIVIPETVTSIVESAFSGCSSLTSIKLPNSVTSIGYEAFSGCGSLISIEIPSSVTNIGQSAFRGCSSLISVSFENNSKLKWLGGYAFENCRSLTSIEIPDSVTYINSYRLFYNCASLESITLPFVSGNSEGAYEEPSFSTLFGYLFSESSYNGGVATRQSYREGSGSTYYIPSSLKTVKITKGKLLYGAFSNCSNLTTVQIASAVTYVGEQVFTGCSKLTIYCEANSKPSGWASNWNPDNRPVQWGYNN